METVKCLKDYLSVSADNYKVFHGSNLDVLPLMADNSVDAIVTDPPYELGFMGKKWDSSGIAYSVELWRECLRVLKPGGHLLSFGGTRTWHRVAVAIEDAGFEVRDSMAWLYGSGFPKSLNIGKAIDKAAGVQGELIGERTFGKTSTGQNSSWNTNNVAATGRQDVFAPATPEAEKWAGWGTALKPAFEPVVVARKPLIGTVAENVLTHGVGGLNIDASRIGRADGDNSSAGNRTATFGTQDTKSGGDGSGGWEQNSGGRWPANILLDDYMAGLLDEQSGVSKSGKAGIRTSDGFNANSYGKGMGIQAGQANGEYGDSGGASRFFYVAKANKRDRNEGLDGLTDTASKRYGDRNAGSLPQQTPQADVIAKNFHPTVKPTDLMRYLIKLVTPAGGTVLDPFTGSGSTGKAALLDGYQFIGIELTEEYLPIIEGRLKWAQQQTAEGIF